MPSASIRADLERAVTAPASLRTPIRDVARSGRLMILEDEQAFVERYGELTALFQQMRGRARVSFPLRAGDQVIGGVTVGFEPRSFDAAELDFFASIANAAALAIERLRLGAAENEARELLATVVAQMPVGVTVTDKDGRILYKNQSFDRVFRGVGVDNLIDGGLLAVRPGAEPRRAGLLPVARSIATGEVVVDEEMEVALADGKTAVITQSSAPVRDSSGAIVGAVAVTVDVTQRKESEQLRDAFLSVLSHELRTPVTTITAGSQFLAARSTQLEPAVVAEVAHDVFAESDRLRRMIDGLLVLAHTERGVDLAIHGITSIAARLPAVVAGVAEEWPDRNVVADVPPDVPPVRGDDGYLDQVLWNLLGNAAKYGRKDVVARVQVQGSGVQLLVLDDGPGIPNSEKDRIFELYARVEATSKKPGTGIGLFVARRLVTAMGGSICVANRPEGGAVFTVTLPIHQDAETVVSVVGQR